MSPMYKVEERELLNDSLLKSWYEIEDHQDQCHQLIRILKAGKEEM